MEIFKTIVICVFEALICFGVGYYFGNKDYRVLQQNYWRLEKQNMWLDNDLKSLTAQYNELSYIYKDLKLTAELFAAKDDKNDTLNTIHNVQTPVPDDDESGILSQVVEEGQKLHSDTL